MLLHIQSAIVYMGCLVFWFSRCIYSNKDMILCLSLICVDSIRVWYAALGHPVQHVTLITHVWRCVCEYMGVPRRVKQIYTMPNVLCAPEPICSPIALMAALRRDVCLHVSTSECVGAAKSLRDSARCVCVCVPSVYGVWVVPWR